MGEEQRMQSIFLNNFALDKYKAPNTKSNFSVRLSIASISNHADTTLLIFVKIWHEHTQEKNITLDYIID